MIYHILNGDALKDQFPKDIIDEKIIFRECLIDGPIESDLEESFWKTRKKFISEDYHDLNYDTYSKAEIEKISKIPDKSEVYFWFEEDCFCQVNFWKAVSLLVAKNHKSYLVLPDEKSPYSFANLSQKDLQDQFQNAQLLTDSDLLLFRKLWDHYKGGNFEMLTNEISGYESRFPFLSKAIQGIEEIKNRNLPAELLIQFKQQNPDSTFQEAFRYFCQIAPHYGLGDLQVLRIWEKIG